MFGPQGCVLSVPPMATYTVLEWIKVEGSVAERYV